MTSGIYVDHPDISPEMWNAIDEIIAANRPVPGSVITVLRECQDVVGYLPVELIDYISRGLNLPQSDVFGVASFYALFSMVPKGRHTIKVRFPADESHLYHNPVVFDTHGNLRLRDGRAELALAVSDVELPAMPGASNDAAL